MTKPPLITRKLIKRSMAKAARIPITIAPPPPCSQLLTKSQMVSRIKSEIDQTSLTATATKYDLKPSQLSDVVYGRANLSKKMLAKLNVRMFEFYELIGMNGRVK